MLFIIVALLEYVTAKEAPNPKKNNKNTILGDELKKNGWEVEKKVIYDDQGKIAERKVNKPLYDKKVKRLAKRAEEGKNVRGSDPTV